MTTMTPGPTTFVVSDASAIASTFYLFITIAIEKNILDLTNLEVFPNHEDNWKRIDETDLHVYIGLLILHWSVDVYLAALLEPSFSRGCFLVSSLSPEL